MSVEDNMLTLASKYSLEEGKTQDYYNLHGKWCLTKNGGEKIRIAEGITYTSPEVTVVAPIVTYQATFTDKAGNIIHMNGSCRFDGTKNTPEKSHAPEMAWKRMETRGTIKILGLLAQGIYGDDEFDTDFKQGTSPAPVAAAPGTTTYTNGEAMTIPPEGTQGWYEGAENLPSQWNGVMAKLSEVTSDDRSKWEMKIIDHLGVFNKDDGTNWYPSSKWSNFAHMAGFLSTYDGVTKSKAKYSYRILKLTRELVDEVESAGSAVIKVANAQGGMDEVRILRKDQKAAPQAPQSIIDAAGVTAPQAPKTFTPDDIPF